MVFVTNLNEIGLNTDNSVVIGSGIMAAKNLRDSNDIDLIVDENMFLKLKNNKRFSTKLDHDREILYDEVFEIGYYWEVLGKRQNLNDLFQKSVVIDRVRYITPEFLLQVKESWLLDDEVRQKDRDDVAILKKFLHT